MRIDKFIWMVRLFKSRSLASTACDKEKVKVNEQFIKPSKLVYLNDLISVKTNPIWRTFKIVSMVKSRVGASLVNNYIVETTSDSELEKLKLFHLQQKQMRGTGFKGRPTKKNKRKLNDFLN